MNKIFLSFAKIFVLTVIFAALTQITFAQDVPRKTVAVTYPLGKDVRLTFRGTTRFPRLRGDAKIVRKNKNGTRVDLSLENLPRPYELGGIYTTYVLWAITPEGRVDNLGELKYRTGVIFLNPKISVTTPLQTFALIVTAEPHFLVREPSRAIILENVAPAGNVATTVNVAYFGNSSDYYNSAKVAEIADIDYAKVPVSLQEARQAINLARYAGAERDATVEFEYALRSLEQAETSWREGGAEEAEVDVLSRNAVAAGARAEEIAGVRKESRLRRDEKARNDEEIRKAEDKAADATQELASLRAELDRQTRARELSERDSLNFTKQLSDIRNEMSSLREELTKAREEATAAKIQIARNEAAQQVAQTQQSNNERLSRIQAAAPILRQSLRPFGVVRDNARGISLTLAESLFSKPREANFSAAAGAKLDNLAQTLSNNPDYKIIIETHTDDKGTADDLQTLTDERARLIADKLANAGIEVSRIEAKGFGATIPIAANTTPANRAKNRRTEITLVLTDSSSVTANTNNGSN